MSTLRVVSVSKIWIWLSILIALLVTITSGVGLFVESIYAKETFSWAAQGIGQDFANLFIAVPALFIAVYFVNKGSVRAFLIWSGVLIYLVYAYIIYAFDVHFNSLFFVYVAILGLSFYTLLGSMIRINLDNLQRYFSANTKARLVSVLLLLVAVLFALLWLREDIPALFTGKIPQTVAESGLPTNPVHVLDLAFTLPGMIITAILLWRKSSVGYLFAIPLLVFSIMTEALIITLFIVMGVKGLPTSFGIGAFLAIILLVSLIVSILF